MECYEGATMIKTFRGRLADGGQDKIRLKTNKGDIGYRIVKFDIMGLTENENYEASVKIYSLLQSAVTTTVDFTDGDLLAAALYHDYSLAATPARQTIVFDNIVFNQDIYVTYAEVSGSGPDINYYIELEQLKLNENESTMATLQSIRQIAER